MMPKPGGDPVDYKKGCAYFVTGGLIEVKAVSASLSPQHRTRACKPSQLLPRDCSAQALLRPHNDGLLHSSQKRGVVDEFQAESDTIQILAKVGYPIAGDICSA
jgi:hypothetical protein